MLEIVIDKTFWLELPDDFSVPFIDENPLFLDDRIPVPHTTNFEVQKTPHNMLFFKFPDRVTTAGMFIRYPAEIIHFGSVIMRGEIIILNVKNNINLQFINAVFPENAKKKMNAIDFGGKDYGSAQLNPEPPFYSLDIYDEYKQEISNSVFAPAATRDFITAPVRLSDQEWDGHKGSWGMKNALRQYINYFNPINQSWTMPDITSEFLGNPFVVQGAGYYCQFPVVPFPYVHFVIEKVFGKQLANNPFYDDENLRRLVLVCFNHKYLNPENYYKTEDILDVFENLVGYWHYVYPIADDYSPVPDNDSHFYNTIRFKSFMQEYPFNEFFKELLKLFGMSCHIGESISIEYDNDMLDSSLSFDLSPFLVKDPVVSGEKAQRYVLSYGVEKTEETIITDEYVGPAVAYIFNHILAGDPLTKSYRIQNNPNMVLELTKKAVGIPPAGQSQAFVVESKIKSSALSVNNIPDNEIETHEVRVDVKPLDMNIEHVWNQLINWDEEYIAKKHWYVPVIPKTDLKAPPHIMLDAGLFPVLEGDYQMQYRQLLNHHLDLSTVPPFNLSLLINDSDPDGVFLKYHQRKASWYAKDKIKLLAEAMLTPVQIKSISNKTKIHLDGKNFLIVKREFNLSAARKIKVTFTLIEDLRS